MANAAQPATPAATIVRVCLAPLPLSNRPRMAVTAKSTAGPATKKMSCSRTIAISAPQRPSAMAPRTRHSRRTCSQTVTKSATANAEHAWENGGATYM